VRKLPLACSRQNLKPELSAKPELKAMPSDEYKNGLLSRGNATGGIRYATPDGRGKLQVRIGGRGRGLFASSTIEKSMLNVLYVSLCKNHLFDNLPGRKMDCIWHRPPIEVARATAGSREHGMVWREPLYF